MRKILLTVVLVTVCLCLFAQAQITPYGSARLGYWYTMTDEDYAQDPDRFQMEYGLQSNSRFGVNFKNNDLNANVEFGSEGNVRFLWARQSFGNWALLVGLAEDATNQGGRQVFNTDNMLRGYGAVYNGRNAMVRFEWNNGLYAALMQPRITDDPAGNREAVDALIPRINIGYNWHHNSVRLLPTFVFQMYNYNDEVGKKHDGSVMSWLGALTFDFVDNDFSTKVHVNYGTNIGQMGYGSFMQGHPVNAKWNEELNETEDITTMGVVFTAGYNITPKFNLNFGVGYVTSDMDSFEEADDRMAFYLQGEFKLNNLRLVPEIGFIDEMNEQGTKMYFGTQLRLDF